MKPRKIFAAFQNYMVKMVEALLFKLGALHGLCKKGLNVTLIKPELVFTKLTLQILEWIYVIAIHSCVFILDLETNIDL
jgi:hypothetical protein